MANIHHATAKKAAAANIALVAMEDGAVATNQRGTQISHSKASEALAFALLDETLGKEYPALELVATDGTVTLWHKPSETEVSSYDFCPSLAEVLDTVQEAELDPEEAVEGSDEEVETEGKGGGVVPSKYRKAYAERGNPNHCGDWLASTLDGCFRIGTGKEEQFDVPSYTAFLIENDVDMSGKWAGLPNSGQAGWIGRYRMNGRQVLEKAVAMRGTLMIGGTEIDVPADALEALRTKHAKWLAKVAKQMAKATEQPEA